MSASNAQLLANRQNALGSTGPSSKVGKKRASRNAFKHGLGRKMEFDHHPMFSLYVDELVSAGFEKCHAMEVATNTLYSAHVLRHEKVVMLQRLNTVGVALEMNGFTKLQLEAFADFHGKIQRYEVNAFGKLAKSLKQK